MKREGRQHGMVRTYEISPALHRRLQTRLANRLLDSPAMVGSFTRVPAKPTNHSKFTGKCGKPRCNGCHLSPTCKAKDKAKGTKKISSNDGVSNLSLSLSGNSATRALDHLASYHDDDDDEEELEEMSFCEVGFELDQDDWCLVGEM